MARFLIAIVFLAVAPKLADAAVVLEAQSIAVVRIESAAAGDWDKQNPNERRRMVKLSLVVERVFRGPLKPGEKLTIEAAQGEPTGRVFAPAGPWSGKALVKGTRYLVFWRTPSEPLRATDVAEGPGVELALAFEEHHWPLSELARRVGDKRRLLACSSPTGPAFEGAQIACGQRAAPGAIERMRIDRQTLEPRYKVIGCDLWSNEEGFAEATAKTGVTGICGSGIIEAIAEMFLSGIVTEDGVIDGAQAARSPRVFLVDRTYGYKVVDGAPGVSVYQSDVRAIQLAKAALYAGAKLLIERFGEGPPERITLAGAFGSHIDPMYAMALGMIPDCDLAHVVSAGNAAGTGARIALLNLASRAEIEGVVRRIDKIETAIEPRFQEHFVAAMAMPNKVDAFVNLAKVIALPERKVAEPRERGRRRRE